MSVDCMDVESGQKHHSPQDDQEHNGEREADDAGQHPIAVWRCLPAVPELRAAAEWKRVRTTIKLRSGRKRPKACSHGVARAVSEEHHALNRDALGAGARRSVRALRNLVTKQTRLTIP